MSNLKPVVVKADVMWAFLDTPNKKSKKYQVDLCNLSDQAVSALKDSGVKVKNDKPEKGAYITAKSSKYPIKAELEDGSPVECKVSNGSKAIATIKPYTWNWDGDTGVGVGINKLVITDLIEYVEGSSAAEQPL